MGLFQYNRPVFGITSAPAIWQRTIDQVLEGSSGTSCILDDMIITGQNDDEHLANLEEVLRRLQAHGLRANKTKCEFFKEKITFCGHDIDRHGLHKSPQKVEAVLKAPRPSNVAELRSFLGLVNYYNRFLPNLSTVVHPLNQLSKYNLRGERALNIPSVNTTKYGLHSIRYFGPKLWNSISNDLHKLNLKEFTLAIEI